LSLDHVHSKGIGHCPIFPKGTSYSQWQSGPKQIFENHSWYKGEVAFKAVDKDEKLIKEKPAGGIYCFFSTM